MLLLLQRRLELLIEPVVANNEDDVNTEPVNNSNERIGPRDAPSVGTLEAPRVDDAPCGGGSLVHSKPRVDSLEWSI